MRMEEAGVHAMEERVRMEEAGVEGLSPREPSADECWEDEG